MTDDWTWRGRPPHVPPASSAPRSFPPIPFPPAWCPPFPCRAGQPLRGWALLRFRLRLLSIGHPTVRSLQRTVTRLLYPVLIDGLAGPQTWLAYHDLARRPS